MHTEWNIHSIMFLKVYLSCVSLDFFAVLGKPTTNINHSTPAATDKWMDGRYQTYYLPCFAVDNKNRWLKLDICKGNVAVDSADSPSHPKAAQLKHFISKHRQSVPFWNNKVQNDVYV